MSTQMGHCIDGSVWHVTQRCQDQQFLMALDVERRRWLYWLFQARRLHGLCVLNYVVTSNHVHLLVVDRSSQSLDASMQLINRRTAQEFNRRLGRRGAVWESDYQATAIQTNAHLARCMTYIDLNMVRAGEVQHPSQWRCSGYHESRHLSKRRGCIDHATLRQLLRFASDKALLQARDGWIKDKLARSELSREPYWSDSIAVGDLAFALRMKRALAFTHPGSRAQREAGCFAVR